MYHRRTDGADSSDHKNSKRTLGQGVKVATEQEFLERGQMAFDK